MKTNNSNKLAKYLVKELEKDSRGDKIFEDFASKFAPRWFELLKWFLILGTVLYLSERTQNIFLKVAYFISYGALFSSMSFSIFNSPLQNIIPKGLAKKSDTYVLVFSLLVSGIIVSGICYLLNGLLNQLVLEGLIH